MARKIVRAHNISKSCFICGCENVAGFHAQFLELEDGELMGVFSPQKEHQSYPGRMHGGMTSAILDETIGRAINALEPEAFGVTMELNVKFRKPIPIQEDANQKLHAVGRITKNAKRLFEGTGEIFLEDGTVAAEAWARYAKLPPERIVDGGLVDEEWITDERGFPEEEIIHGR